jgi:hypothetical protein
MVAVTLKLKDSVLGWGEIEVWKVITEVRNLVVVRTGCHMRAERFIRLRFHIVRVCASVQSTIDWSIGWGGSVLSGGAVYRMVDGTGACRMYQFEVFGSKPLKLDDIPVPMEVNWILVVIEYWEAQTSCPTMRLQIAKAPGVFEPAHYDRLRLQNILEGMVTQVFCNLILYRIQEVMEGF